MRVKTSLSFDEATIPLAKVRADAAGLDLSHWIERAIRNEAARDDVAELQAWESRLPPGDQEILAALAELDRVGLLE